MKEQQTTRRGFAAGLASVTAGALAVACSRLEESDQNAAAKRDQDPDARAKALRAFQLPMSAEPAFKIQA
jgi:hypothetical protein